MLQIGCICWCFCCACSCRLSNPGRRLVIWVCDDCICHLFRQHRRGLSRCWLRYGLLSRTRCSLPYLECCAKLFSRRRCICFTCCWCFFLFILINWVKRGSQLFSWGRYSGLFLLLSIIIDWIESRPQLLSNGRRARWFRRLWLWLDDYVWLFLLHCRGLVN